MTEQVYNVFGHPIPMEQFTLVSGGFLVVVLVLIIGILGARGWFMK